MTAEGDEIIKQNRQRRGYKMIVATPIQYKKFPKAAKAGPLGTAKTTEAAVAGIIATGIAGTLGLAAGKLGGGGGGDRTGNKVK